MGKLNILIVEDNEQHKLFLEEFIKKRLCVSISRVKEYPDFEVGEIIWEKNKRDALEIIRDKNKLSKISILFLDLAIPEDETKEPNADNGKEILEKILENKKERKLLIVIFSQYIEKESEYEEILNLAQKNNSINDIAFLDKNIFTLSNFVVGAVKKINEVEANRINEEIEKSKRLECEALTNVFYLNLYSKPPYSYIKKLKDIIGDFEGIDILANIITDEKRYKEEIKEFYQKAKDEISQRTFEIYVKNEYSPLEFVIMHAPGKEIESVTPQNAKDCLFDIPVHYASFCEEHKAIREKIESNGGKVILFRDLLNDLLKHTRYGIFLKSFLLWKIVKETVAEGKYWEYIKLIKNVNELEDFIFTGKFNGNDILLPIPNFVFTRDWAFCIHDTIYLSKMHYPVRQRETKLAKFVFQFHPSFPKYEEIKKGTLEGGDVLLPNTKTVLLGLSERTKFKAIKELKDKIFNNHKEIEKVIVTNAPHEHVRSMHLDTFLGFINHETVLAYKDALEKEFFTAIFRKDNNQEIKICSLKEIAVEDIGIKNIVPVKDDREQFDDACNIFAVNPEKFLIYNRADKTLKELKRAGFSDNFISFEGSELVLARGGPHCLTLPIKREPK